jgi:hypothetical protein
MKKFFTKNQSETNPDNTSKAKIYSIKQNLNSNYLKKKDKQTNKDVTSTTLIIKSKLVSVREELKEIKSTVSNSFLSSTNLDQIAKKPT